MANIFVSVGIKKIRLTGGEPLVRRGLLYLIDSLVKIGGVEEVTLTTNGILLPFYAEHLKAAGINRVNISLDTLDRFTFESITGSDGIGRVFEGIQASKNAGLKPIKLNVVIMREINDKEIIDFVEFAISNDLILRFIEFMNITPLWKKEYYISIEEIEDLCKRRFRLKRVGTIDSSPAEYYALDSNNLLGFIRTDENNCRNCNRLRLTATGELKICLYEEKGASLKEYLRKGCTDGEIEDIIARRMEMKEHSDYSNYESTRLYMCDIGG